jgi:predicted amidohydrolase
VNQGLHQHSDLFCILWDDLDDETFREHGERWLEDPRLTSLSLTATNFVETGRSIEHIMMWVNNGDDVDARRFATLLGFDRAFRHVHPRFADGRSTPAGLVGLQAHVAARGRLDSGGRGGALLPRLAVPARPSGDPVHKRELFTNVVRVPPTSWDRCVVQRLSGESRLLPSDLSRGLRIACVPVIADPDEMHFATRQARRQSYYTIRPRDAIATRERIATIVANLDRSGALIAIAPELTLSPSLLDRWQAELAERPRHGSRLRWVLAGTGPLSTHGVRSTNTAVLLDGRTGREIARQDKQFPMDFGAAELRRWRLESRLGPKPVAEDLHPGARLTVIDAGVARVAILVCEDLARVVDLGGLVRDLGVTHVLAPEFSRPTKDRRWERAAADVHLHETGTTVIVSNSLVMHSILSSDGGTSFVLPPDGIARLGASIVAEQPVCFDLMPDGSASVH